MDFQTVLSPKVMMKICRNGICLFHSHRQSCILAFRISGICSSNNPITRCFCSVAAVARTPSVQQHQPGPPSAAPLDFSSSSKWKAEKDLISFIKSCTWKQHLRQLHSYLVRTSYLLNPAIFFSFLSRISLPPFQDIPYSRRIFQQFQKPNMSLYGTMIRAHSLSDSSSMGFELYKEMISARGISADALCSLSAIKCCMKMGSFHNGLQVHGRILRDGNISDCFLSSNLVDFYSVNGKYEEACKVFAEMPYRDTFAWNSFISCNMRNKRTRDALAAFHVMERSEGCRPDEVTCLFILNACANLNALELGEGVHNYAKRCGLNGSMKICNSLITMYSKCGSVEKAHEVFKDMPTKDVVTWSAMISGLASNGYGREAIEAFREMLRVGVTPEDQTFTGVLSGCSHSGLVDEGLMFFDSMMKEFGILPNIYHYGCMVDLMGRAGLLHKAYEIICTMKTKPDATIWRTLLGACRIHKDPVLGHRVVEHLIELKAEEAGDYMLLLNIYSSVSDWEKVMEVRKLMKEKGIHTTPACSTIELNGKVHEFVADDTSHPRKRDIYEKLDEINDQLRIAGYVPEITAELHNTDAEKKRTTLSYHSEKLAIAYGVLATPPGTKIRVAKDLRICVDCHNFAKTVSAVYNREVVVRDRNRSHHFHGGCCSCHDYW